MKTILLITLCIFCTHLAQGATELVQREVVLAGPDGTLSTNQILEVSHEIRSGIDRLQSAITSITEGIITIMGLVAAVYAAFVKIRASAEKVLQQKQITALVQGVEIGGHAETKRAISAQSEQLGVAAPIDKIVQDVKKKEEETGFLSKGDVTPPKPPSTSG